MSDQGRQRLSLASWTPACEMSIRNKLFELSFVQVLPVVDISHTIEDRTQARQQQIWHEEVRRHRKQPVVILKQPLSLLDGPLA